MDADRRVLRLGLMLVKHGQMDVRGTLVFDGWRMRRHAAFIRIWKRDRCGMEMHDIPYDSRLGRLLT